MPTAVIAVVVLAVLGAGAYFLTNQPETTPIESETELARTDTDAPAEPAPEEEPMDGNRNDDAMSSSQPDDATAAATPYASEQTYLTPARTSHEIDVTLTVADDGTVVGANVTYDNGDGFSNPHQERFDSAFREQVVGKQLSEIELSRVGGASLTSEAFNAAVADIQGRIG